MLHTRSKEWSEIQQVGTVMKWHLLLVSSGREDLLAWQAGWEAEPEAMAPREWSPRNRLVPGSSPA